MPKITQGGGPTNRFEEREAAPGEPLPPVEESAYPEDSEPLGDPQETAWGAADGYGELTKVALQDELDSRGLPKAGNKDELVERLREDDAKTEGPEPSQED